MIYEMNDELAAQILTNMLDNTPADVDVREGTPTYIALAPVADEFALLYAELKAQEEADFIINEAGEVTMYGTKLELFAAAWGEKRKEGGRATGVISLSSAEPIPVPAGTRVYAPATMNVLFETDVDSIATPLGTSVTVTAVYEGSDGNLSSQSITGVVGDLEGMITISNPFETSGGYDEESDEEFAARFLNNRRNEATSGNAAHYRLWATEVAGIEDAYVIPVWNGPNTVKVIVLSSAHNAPTPEKVQEVHAYIESVRPIIGGINPVTVEAAGEVPINISATVVISESSSIETIRAGYAIAIQTYLESLAFGTEDIVRIVRLQNALLDIEGIIDISSFTLSGGIANILIPAGSVAIKGLVTINV